MLYIPYLFPLVAALIAAVMRGDISDYWFLYLIGVVACDLIIWIFYFFLTTCNEYLSGYVVKMVHENAWVERVRTRETRTENGKTVTETKIKYVHHPDKWYEVLNTGENITVTSRFYDYYRNMWGGEYYISVHHSNLESGGGGYEFKWNGDEGQSCTATYTGRYRNPLRNTNSIFRGTRMKRKMAKKIGLFDYPSVKDSEQQVILRHEAVNCPDDFFMANVALQRLNAFCGSKHQIHVFILLFPADMGIGISQQQYDYWKSLNKNELVVCLGIDDGKVKWTRAMCWGGEPKELDILYRDYYISDSRLRLTEFVYFMRDNIDKWKRVEAKDFKYLGTHMSFGGGMLYLFISLILSAVILYVALS